VRFEKVEPVTAEVTIEDGPFGPVVRPKDDAGTVVLYLHHGHDASVGPDAVLAVARGIASRIGATVVCAHYREAFADALEDVTAAYRSCRELGPVAVAGERFGAWLVAALLLRLRDTAEELPRCVVLVGALLDLSMDSRSLRLQADADPGFDVAGLRQRVAHWAAEPGSTDALLTPLSANLHGLPPIQLLVAGTDPLLDDSLAFSARAAHDRVQVELRVVSDRAALRTEVVPAASTFLDHRLGATDGDG
jgi:epsilon-lactone hydrolase